MNGTRNGYKLSNILRYFLTIPSPKKSNYILPYKEVEEYVLGVWATDVISSITTQNCTQNVQLGSE